MRSLSQQSAAFGKRPVASDLSGTAVLPMPKTTPPNPQATDALPPAVAELLQEASRALSLDQPKSAERALDHALAIAPGNAESHRLMGIAALMTGNHLKAIGSLRSALTEYPNDAAINMTLGSVLFETGAIEDGLAHLRRACELVPESADAWYNLGVALEFACFELNSTGHMKEARTAFERTVDIDPRHIKARIKLATALVSLGDTPAAVETLRDALRRQPDCVDAWAILGNLQTETLSHEDVARLQSLLRRPEMPDDSRIPLAFTLAKALEGQCRYGAAFDALSDANALKRRHVDWSRRRERARVDAIAQTFARPLSESSDALLGEEVIFVVCVPRSGSTLTEQILASHPQVRGGGETGWLIDILKEESDRLSQPFLHWIHAATSADWRRLGEAYLKRIGKLRGQHPRFTDKSIDNWAYVGAALAMLPGARVVNARRDPLETCFACYRQLFPEGGCFSYDLDDMADYYAGYARLSTLWRQQFPERYFDSSYEALQKDAEGQIRRLLRFCTLPFDPACLASHLTPRTVTTMSSSQVREPLRQNTARSELYGTRLDPLRVKLRAAGVPIGGV